MGDGQFCTHLSNNCGLNKANIKITAHILGTVKVISDHLLVFIVNIFEP